MEKKFFMKNLCFDNKLPDTNSFKLILDTETSTLTFNT